MTTLPHSPPPAPEAWRSHGTTAPTPWHRLGWVDLLRGIALLGMLAYHGAWDLHAFAITATDPGESLGWRLLGRGIAGLFLALSGFGLSLAARHGSSRRAMALRLGRIAAAAMSISLVTWLVVPEAPILFGILHCIVVTNGLALAIRRLPRAALLAAAAAAVAAPFALHGIVGPGWAWIGLAAREPATLDFRPVLPWLAPVLVGVVLGRTTLATSPGPLRLSGRITGAFAWAGRHSLFVYLGHQPLLIAALAIAVGIPVQRDRAADALRNPGQAAAFLQQCRNACSAKGGEEALCRSTCHCVLTTAVSGAAPVRSPSIFGSAVRSLDAAVAICQRAPAPEKP